MNEQAGFGGAQAQRLQQLLARRADREAMGYHELAGFLFAVCAAPDLVQPSEWLDLLMEDEPPLFEDPKLFEQALPLVLALYEELCGQVEAGRFALAADCTLQPTASANLAADAPLSLWARGFIDGHDWLAQLWSAEVSEDFDEALGGCLVALGFFATPELAAEFHQEYAEPGESFEAMAGRILVLLPDTMASYVALGRQLGAARRMADGAEPCGCGSGKPFGECCGIAH